MKKLIASVLALALLMSLALLPAHADETLTFTQNGVTYKYEILRNGRVKLLGGCSADEGVTTINIPSTIDGREIERIGALAFDGCKASSITIPPTVNTIEAYAFNGCEAIEAITIPKGTFFIEGNPFTGCTKLISISLERDIGKDHDTLEVTSDGALYSKRNKMLLCYPYAQQAESFTAKAGTLVIGKSAFDGCDKLETITLPETVLGIADSAFKGCTELKAVVLPESLLSIGESAFEACAKLEAVAVPSQVTRLENSAFEACGALAAVTLPEKMTFIGDEAFKDCAALPAIEVPVNVNTIGDKAFNGCAALKDATVPATVTEIGDSAFDGCNVALKLHVGPYAYAEIYARIYSLDFTYDTNDNFLQQ